MHQPNFHTSRLGSAVCTGMRLAIAAVIRRLLSVDRNSLLLAGLNLVAGIVITTLLVLAARDTAYPPAVGLALALLVGGVLTCGTVLVSLFVGAGGPPDELVAGNGPPSDSERKS